ncbi:glycosyltransferase family 4 protein [Actinoplanes sp. NBC_00393]|uniref:glycosyltransferase family 4 protein n=1 Tax=Actinoplanes sp. NBC_00393 TaxID=2975953 RepID=UPI002E1ECA06
MKVRYVLHNAYGVGGTIRTVFNQANALCAEHDVEIASVYRSAAAPAFTLDSRVRLVPLTGLRSNGTNWDGTSRFWRKTRRLPNPLPHRWDFRYRRWDPVVDWHVVRYFRAQRDTILVTTRPGLNLLAAWFAPRAAVRIGQDHMNFGSYGPRLQRAIARAYPRLDAVTVLTRADLAAYQEALGDTVRLARIPNGIPARPPVPPGERAPIVVAAGRLTRQKGFDLLIDAWAEVHAKHPDWQLHIHGAGNWRPRLAAQVTRRGLDRAVRLRGLTRTLDAELAQASIFALSSRREGLPMVLLEAMAAGLPVVSFDCPTGPAEVVADGVNGLLVPPEDVAGLAAGLSRLIADRGERERMGGAARQTATGYEMPVVAAQWNDLFAQLAR